MFTALVSSLSQKTNPNRFLRRIIFTREALTEASGGHRGIVTPIERDYAIVGFIR